MEDIIKNKIESIVKHIASKPNEAITLEDYTILSSELKDIRFRKSQEESGDRFKKLMDLAFPTNLGCHVD